MKRTQPVTMRPHFLFLTSTLLLLTFPAQAQNVCMWDPDADGDNVIGANDILALLGVFEEVDSDGDGIFDCQDDCLGMYDACGNCNGTGVDADADGVCDDVDPCVGAIDPCGVCNGPGPSVAVIEDGSCTYGPAQCGGQSTVTFDGHTYALVGIGTQCWFAENLRSDHYRNGDAIPGNLSNASWQNTTSGAQTVYNNDAASLANYGRLYNWYATQDSRGLCPTGWHVPSDGEWMTLEMSLGMTQTQATAWSWRGADQGTSLKSAPTDSPSWNGSNVSGFGGLPEGNRNHLGNFELQGSNGLWWTSSPVGNFAIYRMLGTANSGVARLSTNLASGFSVRCVRD